MANFLMPDEHYYQDDALQGAKQKHAIDPDAVYQHIGAAVDASTIRLGKDIDIVTPPDGIGDGIEKVIL